MSIPRRPHSNFDSAPAHQKRVLGQPSLQVSTSQCERSHSHYLVKPFLPQMVSVSMASPLLLLFPKLAWAPRARLRQQSTAWGVIHRTQTCQARLAHPPPQEIKLMTLIRHHKPRTGALDRPLPLGPPSRMSPTTRLPLDFKASGDLMERVCHASDLTFDYKRSSSSIHRFFERSTETIEHHRTVESGRPQAKSILCPP